MLCRDLVRLGIISSLEMHKRYFCTLWLLLWQVSCIKVCYPGLTDMSVRYWARPAICVFSLLLAVWSSMPKNYGFNFTELLQILTWHLMHFCRKWELLYGSPWGQFAPYQLWGKWRSNDPSGGDTSHYNSGYLTSAVFLSDSQILCGHIKKKKLMFSFNDSNSNILSNECKHYTVVLQLLPLYGTLEHTGSQGQSQECTLNTFTSCLGDILCTGVYLRPIKCCV